MKRKQIVILAVSSAALVLAAAGLLFFGAGGGVEAESDAAEPEAAGAVGNVGAAESPVPGPGMEQAEAGHGEPQEAPVQLPEDIALLNYREQGGRFELPVNGATGWAARNLAVRLEPQAGSEVLVTLLPGQGFLILEEDGAWWQVQPDADTVGWVEHGGCFINLPDILPSIIYKITNAQASLKRSSGHDIPNISGRRLYDAWALNPRLGRFEYATPALYAMCGKIAQVQSLALANGDSIVMYEAFRPRETQQKVVGNFRYLILTNEDVNRNVNTPPWSMGAFIATSLSDHQRGAAIDISIARVISWEARAAGGYAYMHITEYEEYETPTPMHELSPQSAAHRITPGSGAARLRGYCVDEVGLRPVSSEWWHFSDRESTQIAARNGINGAFTVYSIHSLAPYEPSGDGSVIIFSIGMPYVPDPPPLPETPVELSAEEMEELFIETLIADMSLEEMISQLFIVRGIEAFPEASDDADASGGVDGVPGETDAGDVETGEQEAGAVETEEPEDPDVSSGPDELYYDIEGFASLSGAGGLMLHYGFDSSGEDFGAFLEASGEMFPIAPFIFSDAGDGMFSLFGLELLPEEDDMPFAPADFGLEDEDYLPFVFLIAEGAEFAILSHVVIIDSEGLELPLTLSEGFIIHGMRDMLGFEGVIVTAPMDDALIADSYSPADAAVMAILAGADMLLMPSCFDEALDGILSAVEDEVIQYERIYDSLWRILKAKLSMGLISMEEAPEEEEVY